MKIWFGLLIFLNVESFGGLKCLFMSGLNNRGGRLWAVEQNGKWPIARKMWIYYFLCDDNYLNKGIFF